MSDRIPALDDDVREALEGLSTKQHAAIQALYTAQTLTAAAEMAGVSRAQLYRWLKHDEAFQRADAFMRAVVLQQHMRRLGSMYDKALTVIERILDKGGRADQLKAAKMVLDATIKLRGTDVDERLSALEHRQEEIATDWRALQDATPEEINRRFQAVQAAEQGEG